MKGARYRDLPKVVWCSLCSDDSPVGVNKACCLAPKRTLPYQLNIDGLTINKEVIGVCDKCKKKLNKFQKDNIERVDYGHKHLCRKVM